jgi:glutathione S-transferase
MAKLKIYGVAYSRAFRAIWAALELGIDYDNVPVGWHDDSLYGGDYRRINPNRRLPAIADDGFVLWESFAINLYLAKKAGGPLAPRSLEEEALTHQWTLWTAIHLERPFVLWAFHTFVNDPDERDPAIATKSLEEITPLLTVLEGQLALAPYLLGDRFTIADLNVACAFHRPRDRFDFAPFPHVKTWCDGAYDRLAAQKALAIRKESTELY